MYEELIINKVLSTKSLKPIKEQGLKSEHFLTCSDKVDFILDHFQTYNVIPDPITFLDRYRDFEMIEVLESDEYLAYKLKEAFLYKDLVPVIKSAEGLIREDSYKATQFLKENIDNLIKNCNIQVGRGYDVFTNAEDRLIEYRKRCETRGLLGISSSVQLLDEYTHGWLAGEDLITLVGRTNEGKTWILLFLLVHAWLQGKKVLMYSGEMGKDIIGFRIDSFVEHFSNMGLMNGNTSLGGNTSLQDYERYIEEVKQKSGFIIVTPKDFGGNKPTVDELKNLCVFHGADILGVDQISLMTDQRKGELTRVRFTNISEDLFNLSAELHIPVINVVQAGRSAVKDKESKENTPELVDINESDGIAQNSSRVITMKVIDGILKLSLKKNRYGVNNRDVLLRWDIDVGIIRPLLEGEVHADTFGF